MLKMVPTEVVVSTALGRASLQGFEVTEEFLAFMIGENGVYDLSTGAIFDKCLPAVHSQFPWIKDLHFDGDLEDYSAWVMNVVAEQGNFLKVEPLSFTETTSARDNAGSSAE